MPITYTIKMEYQTQLNEFVPIQK